MNYHILTQSKDKRRLQVAFHIPVPQNGVNKAGTSWRDAIVEEAGGSDNINSVVPSLAASPEEIEMKAGALIEVAETVKLSLADSDAQKKTRIENRYTELTAKTITEKQKTLEWIGYKANIA